MSTNGRVIVRSFGPIQQADIALRDLTVFIGPQASGKSLVSQVLFFMMWLELGERGQDIDHALAAWLGAPLSTYATSDTMCQWFPDGTDEASQMWWDGQAMQGNALVQQRLAQGATQLEKHVYIPAGRSLYSYVPPHTMLRLNRQLPGYILLFYDALGSAIEHLATPDSRIANSMPPSPARMLLEQRMDALVQGKIRYSHETMLVAVGNGKKQVLASQLLAAGQREILPFLALVQDGVIARQQLRFVVLEEPEAHLHPGAQRMVMEMVAILIRQGVRVVLTTHSPYILYALNNALLAHKVHTAGHPLPTADQKITMLSPSQVAAYRFAPSGYVSSRMDDEVGLIDAEELEQVAEDLGAEFAHLQDLLSGEGDKA